MATGQFFGGIATGIDKSPDIMAEPIKTSIALARQQEDARSQQQSEIDSSVYKTLKFVDDTVKQAVDSGKDPNAVAGLLQPVIESTAKTITDPNAQARFLSMSQAIINRAGGGQAAQPAAPAAPSAAPDTSAPLSSTDTIAPSQVAAANPTPAVPVQQPTPNPTPDTLSSRIDQSISAFPPTLQPPDQTGDVSIPSTATPVESTANLKASDIPIKNPKVQALIDSGQTSQDDLDFRAQLWLLNQKSTVGLGRGKEGAAFVNAIQARAAEIARARGLDPGELNAMSARTAALGRSLTEITRTANALEAFEKTAEKNGDAMVELAKKIDQTGIPIIEKYTRQGRQALGDSDVAAFKTQYELYKAEVAKILTQSNMQGVLTDTARKEISDAIQPGASARQLIKVHELLKADFARRNAANQEQIDKIMGQFQQKNPAQLAPTAPAQNPNDLQRLKEKYGLK